MIWRNTKETPLTLSRLERLEVIEFIVAETDRNTQGDFEVDMLWDQLNEMTDEQLDVVGETMGWM
jgi:hypothetical protein